MNIVYVVEAVYCDGYEYKAWIMSMFDSEEKAKSAVSQYYAQDEEDGVNPEDNYYRIKKWEVQ